MKLTVDDKVSSFSGNGALESAMSGIKLEHVDHVVKTDEGVVDGYNFCALGDSSTEHQTANTAKSVDSDFRHD